MSCLSGCDGTCCTQARAVRCGLIEDRFSMYRSEAAFSKALTNMLKDHVSMVQRIESHLTGCGIPDVYLRSPRREMWIELKNDPLASISSPMWEVKWRKGQQAWLLYYELTSGLTPLTIVAMRDGYVIVPMNKRYKNNLVTHEDVWTMDRLKDIWDVLEAQGL